METVLKYLTFFLVTEATFLLTGLRKQMLLTSLRLVFLKAEAFFFLLAFLSMREFSLMILSYCRMENRPFVTRNAQFL